MLGIKKSILPVLCFTALTSVAQKAEEYPDFRTKKESFSKMSDKTLRADLGVFSIGGIEESLNKLPLKKVSASGYQQDYMRFKGENIEVTVTLGNFDETGKKIQKMDDHILKINGKPYYGCYGKMPETAIKSVTVLVGKDTVLIPPAAYADLFDTRFTFKDKSGTERTSNGVFFSKDGSRIYIYLLSRNDKDSYEVTWVIQNKQYLRRVLDWGF